METFVSGDFCWVNSGRIDKNQIAVKRILNYSPAFYVMFIGERVKKLIVI